MNTATTTHHPIRLSAAAGVAVAALAITAGVLVSDRLGSTAPEPAPQPQVPSLTHHHFHPTTSGGKVMTGF